MNPIDPILPRLKLSDVDYVADVKAVGPSSEAQTLINVLRAMRPIEDCLDLAWVGAMVAHMFMKHAWLQSVSLGVSAESQYNDEGGSYMSHSVRFTSVTRVPGVHLPDDLANEDGAFDDEGAVELLEHECEDEAFNFAAPFLSANAEDEVTLQLNREALAPLLSGGTAASGLAVARLLWPDHEVVRRLALPRLGASGQELF
jgi:hypothetical protein